MNRLYNAAIFCGAAPLVTGALIFIGWMATGQSVFQGLGLLNILGGLVLFCIGVVCTITYASMAIKRKVDNWDMQAWKAGMLLVANFPVAIFMIASSSKFDPAFNIVVENRSTMPLENILVQDPARKIYRFDDVPAQATAEQTFRMRGEGSVTFRATHGAMPKSGVLVSYKAHGMGTTCKLIINADGSLESCELNRCAPLRPFRPLYLENKADSC